MFLGKMITNNVVLGTTIMDKSSSLRVRARHKEETLSFTRKIVSRETSKEK